MKRFKIKDLLISLPGPENKNLFNECLANTRVCLQVTIPNCPDITKQPVCNNRTQFPEGCQQVTIPNCQDRTQPDNCFRTENPPIGCQQVTYIDCRDRTLLPDCGSRTIAGCQQVTILECGSGTKIGAASPGTHYGPRCDCSCTNTCTKTDDKCTYHTPGCGCTKKNTEKDAIGFITEQIHDLDLDSLGVLKEQMRQIIKEIESKENSFLPNNLEDIEGLEAKLKEGLEELQKRKDELKQKGMQ